MDMSMLNMPQGTQVIGRTAMIIDAIVCFPENGATTADIASRTSITRPTTHRLLQGLEAIGYVEHTPEERWMVGPTLAALGITALGRDRRIELATPVVRDIAEKTGESAFFSVRSGFQTVCLLKHEGAFPLRSFVLYPGKRFPVGVASAGIAFAAATPERVLSASLHEHRVALAAYGPNHTPHRILERVTIARQHGYALNPGLILTGSWGMGVTVPRRSAPIAEALVVTGVESRFTAPHIEFLKETLSREAARLGDMLDGSDE